MPEIIGTYRFSPPVSRDGSLKRRDGGTTEWWMIIQCDRDVGRYLRQLYQQAYPEAGPINEPLWGPHVSVIQDERPLRMEQWKDRDGQEVSFHYEQTPMQEAGYVYFPVSCPQALDYREALGLPREPQVPLHLTIGNHKTGSQ